MAKLILFNKPFDVLCQFTDSQGRRNLSGFLNADECRNCYPAGRLDRDSEGLLLLTDSGALQQQISDPRFKLPKIYWVQVEGEPGDSDLEPLRRGLLLKDGPTRPAQASIIGEPPLEPRVPPIRYRATVGTTWLEITISEGRNRQIRRMTAALGLPTLRLVRVRIGPWHLRDLPMGHYRIETVHPPQSRPPARPFHRQVRTKPRQE